MLTSSEIQSAVANIKYYASRIKELAKQQYEEDFTRGQEQGINTIPGSIRFDGLGAIITGSEWLDIYCQNISLNLEVCEEQDKLLFTYEQKDEAGC